MDQYLIQFANEHKELAWAVVILGAWFSGEYIRQWVVVPRICIYGFIGFVCAESQAGILSAHDNQNLLLLANIAFGLILFEVGYRINMQWFRINYWLACTSLTECMLTFVLAYQLCIHFNLGVSNALLLSALCMSTSPAAIIRVINDERSSGQVTERAVHLSAANCVVSVLIFKLALGYYIFQTSGNVIQAAYTSLVVLMASIILGYGFGVITPLLLKAVNRFSQDGTLAFSVMVILLVTLSHALKLSPIIATVMFGVTARHRRIVLSQTRRNFGVLGDLIGIFLFVFVSTTMDWVDVKTGLGMALVIIPVRILAKVTGCMVFARPSGISWKKGFLTGVALSPISVFVILILEQTRYMGIGLVDQLAPLAAITLVLELGGPILTQYALRWANEAQESGVQHAA